MTLSDTPQTSPDHEPMTPEEVLDITIKEAQRLAKEATVVLEMLKEGKKQNLPVDISDILEPFEPLGVCEKQLLNLTRQIDQAKIKLLHQGVEITYEEMRARLAKLGL